MDQSKLAVNTYNKIASIYTKEYFNDLSDSKYLNKFLKLIPKGGKILDVGSGPGQFSKYIKTKGFNISGIDYSDEMISIAKKQVKGIIFKQMDMRKLNFGDESFNGLLAAYSLIHIPSNEVLETLKGFNRVLKQAGYIEIITQKGEADQTINEPFMPSEKMFFNFFTKERISNFLKKAGFKVVYQKEERSLDPNSVGNKIIYTIAKKQK